MEKASNAVAADPSMMSNACLTVEYHRRTRVRRLPSPLPIRTTHYGTPSWLLARVMLPYFSSTGIPYLERTYGNRAPPELFEQRTVVGFLSRF
jgi:hypothetical protein